MMYYFMKVWNYNDGIEEDTHFSECNWDLNDEDLEDNQSREFQINAPCAKTAENNSNENFSLEKDKIS